MALEKYTPNEIPTSTKFNAMVDEVNSLSANKYTKPSSGIPATDLAAGVIPDSAEDITYDSTLESHTTGSVGAKLSELSLKVGTIEGKESGWDGKYEKPVGGIPSTDLASGVIPDVSGKVNKPSEDGAEGQVLGLGADGETVWKDGGGNTDDIEEVAAAALIETREYIDALLNGITKRGKIIMSKDVVNNLNATSTLVPLSAWMGRMLHQYQLDNEQVTAAAINDMATLLKPTAIAPVYKTSKVYSVGDVVMYEGNLYKCLEAIETPEFFDATKWEQTSVIEIINNL